MSDSSGFDAAAAHRYFAPDCFNRAWALMDKATRTEEEDEQMLLLASASLWHWTQREDVTPGHLSVGHWQVSRVCAMLGDGERSMRHARRSLAFAEGSPPFYGAYGHEAIARAARVLGDDTTRAEHLDKARALVDRIEDAEERALIEPDLESLTD